MHPRLVKSLRNCDRYWLNLHCLLDRSPLCDCKLTRDCRLPVCVTPVDTVRSKCAAFGIADGFLKTESSPSPKSRGGYWRAQSVTWPIPQPAVGSAEVVVQAEVRARGKGVSVHVLASSGGAPLLAVQMRPRTTWLVNSVPLQPWPQTYANPFDADQVSRDDKDLPPSAWCIVGMLVIYQSWYHGSGA